MIRTFLIMFGRRVANGKNRTAKRRQGCRWSEAGFKVSRTGSRNAIRRINKFRVRRGSVGGRMNLTHGGAMSGLISTLLKPDNFAQISRYLIFTFALVSAGFGAGRSVSVADCRFVANRDEFLGRQAR